MERIRIYISGPYTQGDTAQNVRRAIDFGNRLLDEGFAPYIPHLCHFWHLIHSRHYEDWMELDFSYISICSCLYRLPGDSEGADREVAFAKKLGIPVFDTYLSLIAWSKKQRDRALGPL